MIDMIEESEFTKRFIKRIIEQCVGQITQETDARFLAECADGGGEMYREDPDDMTPEDCADSEMDCWGN